LFIGPYHNKQWLSLQETVIDRNEDSAVWVSCSRIDLLPQVNAESCEDLVGMLPWSQSASIVHSSTNV